MKKFYLTLFCMLTTFFLTAMEAPTKSSCRVPTRTKISVMDSLPCLRPDDYGATITKQLGQYLTMTLPVCNPSHSLEGLYDKVSPFKEQDVHHKTSREIALMYALLGDIVNNPCLQAGLDKEYNEKQAELKDVEKTTHWFIERFCAALRRPKTASESSAFESFPTLNQESATAISNFLTAYMSIYEESTLVFPGPSIFFKKLKTNSTPAVQHYALILEELVDLEALDHEYKTKVEREGSSSAYIWFQFGLLETLRSHKFEHKSPATYND